METQKALKVYGILGKSLCGCAGAIVGFVIAGPLAALAGIIVGVVAGEFLESLVLKTAH